MDAAPYQIAGRSPIPFALSPRLWVRRDGISRDLILDEATLRRIGDEPGSKTLIEALLPAPPEMIVNIEEEGQLALAWTTLPPNRDLPSPTVPAPTILYLVERGEDSGLARWLPGRLNEKPGI